MTPPSAPRNNDPASERRERDRTLQTNLDRQRKINARSVLPRLGFLQDLESLDLCSQPPRTPGSVGWQGIGGSAAARVGIRLSRHGHRGGWGARVEFGEFSTRGGR